MTIHPSHLAETVEQHDQDLYRGDSRKPGLTTRMELVENDLATLTKNSNRLVWAAVATLLGLIAEIIKSTLLK